MAWFILPTTPPFNLPFFCRVPPGFRQVSARFPPGSAGFRRIPAGFRRVPLGSAGFRRVPPLRRVPLGSAGFQVRRQFTRFCRVSANKVPAPGSPLQFIAKIVPGSCQASAKVAAIKEALFVIARTLSKSAYGKNRSIRWLPWWSSILIGMQRGMQY